MIFPLALASIFEGRTRRLFCGFDEIAELNTRLVEHGDLTTSEEEIIPRHRTPSAVARASPLDPTSLSLAVGVAQ